jgi:hypothetical protein
MSPAPALDHAQSWLRMQLAGGPKPAASLLATAGSAGISAAALRQAKRALGVESRRESRLGAWSWALPACESSARGHLQGKLLDFLLERSEEPDLPAAERRRFKREADALARRRAEEAEAEDLAAFAADSREAPYKWRRRARWPEEAA